jgi:hypothetical protein
LLALGLAAPRAQSKAAAGDLVPDFTFPEFLTGGDGRQKLSEFRGEPVLIVNWTDTDFGRGGADGVRKLAKELVPEGLVLILRDTHNKSADEIRAAAMRLYPGSPARFTRNMEEPIEYEQNGPPPHVALIDVEGRIAVAGSYTVELSGMEKLVKAELKKQASGWGTHDAAREARALLFGEGRLAEALARCDEALAAEPEQPELLAVRGEIQARWAALERSVRYHMERGEYGLALEKAQALGDAVAGGPAPAGGHEWEEAARTLLAELDTPEAQAELELDAALASALKPLGKDEPTPSDVKKLERLAEEAGDTRVGRRARELARIASLAIR